MSARRETEGLRRTRGVGGVGTEVGENESRCLERAIAVAERAPYAVVAETDNVGPSVTGQIGSEPGMLTNTPTGDDAEFGSHEVRWLERAVTGSDRRPHTVVAEPDDVGPSVAGEIGDQPGMLIDTPAGVDTEGGKSESRLSERSVAVAEDRPDSGVVEADKVGSSVTGEIGREPGVLVDTPIGETGDDELRWLERAVAVAEDRPYTVVTEPDDVTTAITSQIGDEPRMLIDTPPRIDTTEVADQLRWLERAVAVAEYRPYTVVTEPDDVTTAITSQIGDEPRMLIDTPPRIDTTEVADQLRWLERAVAVAEYRPYTVVTEPDDVGPPVASQIGDEPGMLIDTPPRIDTTEVADQLRWLERAVAVAEYCPYTVVTEPDDVGPPVASQISDDSRMLIGPIETCPAHRDAS